MMVNTIYDANIWSKVSYQDIEEWIKRSNNFLIDDTAAELYTAGYKFADNKGFISKLSLAFNTKWGLNDNFSLVLFEVPWRLPIIYENSIHTINPKNEAFSCSLYHYWLRYAISPAIIIEPLICLNSALTLESLNNEDPLIAKQIEGEKNRVRQEMLKRIKPYFDDSMINAKTLIRSWKKRDDSIKNNTLKLTDYREVLFALIKMVSSRENVVILTADYDLVDIQNNLYMSIIDQYVVQMILLQKIEEGFDIDEEPKRIFIDQQTISQKFEEVSSKIESASKYAGMIVMFYSDKDGKIYPFENKYPAWLLKFLADYRGNANCLSLPYNPESIYQIRYVWYMNTIPSDEGIGFDVWLNAHKDGKLLRHPTFLSKMGTEDMDKEQDKACFPMICKPICRFEHEEYNHAKKLSSFVDKGINEKGN